MSAQRLAAIGQLADVICQDFGCHIVMAAEIECYVYGIDSLANPDLFWRDVLHALTPEGTEHSAVESIAAETAPDQFEFRFRPTSPVQAAGAVLQLKHQLPNLAARYGLSVSFDALPAGAGAGSALQWHLHLTDEQGQHLFFKQDDQLSPALWATLGGLLYTLPALMSCFAPTDASYARLTSGHDHVPQTLSWGGNNRSVALRLPESVVPLRHIEHRIAGADACPALSGWAVLVGVHYGLHHQPDPGTQYFGNATRNKADRPALPASTHEAEAARQAATWLAEYTHTAA